MSVIFGDIESAHGSWSPVSPVWPSPVEATLDEAVDLSESWPAGGALTAGEEDVHPPRDREGTIGEDRLALFDPVPR